MTKQAYNWDVEDSEYIFLGDGETITIKMIDEGIGTIDNYKNDCVDFHVNVISGSLPYAAFWRVTSARVKRTLKKMRPIAGKTIEVKRNGEGYDTRYVIKEVTNIDQFIPDDQYTDDHPEHV